LSETRATWGYFFQSTNHFLQVLSVHHPLPRQNLSFNHIVWAPRIWSPWAFYLIVSKGPIHWDFPIGPGHFRVSGSFLMKKSFKRMIRSSCRVEPCSTIYNIDLPKNKAFFWINQFIWDPSNPLFFLFKDQPLSLCFHIENSLQMKRCQKGFLLLKQILLHLYTNAGLSRIRKKSTLNYWFIARDGLEPRVHYLMDFFIIILYPRVISIYQICSYLKEGCWIKWQRHCWEKDGFSQMKWKLDSVIGERFPIP